MKILIIEDEVLLADSLKELLESKGFQADTAFDGQSGLDLASSGSYDLLLLDVMLPDISGFQVAKQLRAGNTSLPILMLTAKSDLEDRIEGLDSGADYYLAKPFDALLRRQGEPVNELSYGNTLLELASNMLVCGDQHVRLSAKEFEVMHLLMQYQHTNLPKETILAHAVNDLALVLSVFGIPVKTILLGFVLEEAVVLVHDVPQGLKVSCGGILIFLYLGA